MRRLLVFGLIGFAAQLIDFPVAGGLTVAMGGGRTEFMPAGADDPEYPNRVGQRLDGRDLIGEWTSSHPDGKYVWNAAQLKTGWGQNHLRRCEDPSGGSGHRPRVRQRSSGGGWRRSCSASADRWAP